MSSPNLSPSVTNCVKVIVRAVGDEPVVLSAIGGDARSIQVIGSDAKQSINYPAQYVYEYDNVLFDRLDTAFCDHEANHLQDAWKDAKHYLWK